MDLTCFNGVRQRRVEGFATARSNRIELLPVPGSDQFAFEQQRRAVRVMRDDIQRMRRQQYGTAGARHAFMQLTLENQRTGRIEPIEGFIEHDEARIGNQCQQDTSFCRIPRE